MLSSHFWIASRTARNDVNRRVIADVETTDKKADETMDETMDEAKRVRDMRRVSFLGALGWFFWGWFYILSRPERYRAIARPEGARPKHVHLQKLTAENASLSGERSNISVMH
jgi:hypothetical protein